ncbi:MAG TPA: hypothetical protein VGN04_11650 [Herbaspirillum sp.]
MRDFFVQTPIRLAEGCFRYLSKKFATAISSYENCFFSGRKQASKGRDFLAILLRVIVVIDVIDSPPAARRNIAARRMRRAKKRRGFACRFCFFGGDCKLICRILFATVRENNEETS